MNARTLINASPTRPNEATGKRPSGDPARSGRIIAALVFFLAGAALSALWFTRGVWLHSSAENPVAFSTATRAVLSHLDAPVEIRFYSMLDASSVPEPVQAFAGRVDQLLGRYEQAGGGRVRVVRCETFSNSSANAAEADGINAFNNDKGNACFLGIAVVCGGQKESLPRLVPEWEQALEPDLTRAITRAIARAVESRPGAQRVARIDTSSLDAVRKAIPDLDAVSLEEGTRILRDASMVKFKQAVNEMDASLKDAEQRLIQAQASQSEAAQQSAAEELRKIQAEGTRKIQQIAQDSHAQIAALQQLKKASP
ncbi:MAG: Gldg family protein [Limisphaerales bacterium]